MNPLPTLFLYRLQIETKKNSVTDHYMGLYVPLSCANAEACLVSWPNA